MLQGETREQQLCNILGSKDLDSMKSDSELGFVASLVNREAL
jgi:hypothetical protein